MKKTTQERQEEIIQAVLHIIGTTGIQSLKTNRIAQELGLSSGALFRHFATLEVLLQETMKYSIALLEKTFPSEALPPLPRLFSLLENRIRLFRREPGLFWILRSEEASLVLPQNSIELLKKTVTHSKKFILQALQEGMQQHQIRRDIEPESFLLIITGTIHALVGAGGIHGKVKEEEKEKVEACLKALEKILSPLPCAKEDLRNKS
jgi:TetR/AcrR family transcriptional regulator